MIENRCAARVATARCNMARAQMTAIGPRLPLDIGQSMSAPPGYFRPRPVRLWREHHPLQCRDSAPCSQSWYVPIAVERHVDCRFGDRSASPWFDVASACRKNLDPIRYLRSNRTPITHTAVLSCIVANDVNLRTRTPRAHGYAIVPSGDLRCTDAMRA
jgi:hypothetical protein